MKQRDLKKLILSLTQDVVFNFEGEVVCVNPYNAHKFEVGYKEDVLKYNDIDTLMGDKIFNGKSLNEISNNINVFCF